ncbi:fucose isomerase [Sphingobacterium tabacisoli]|uniref:Fucose isomerase n=1 Tax=Sphingobacterium tabacisoli TaxID=2044855 RepID=A0ABW5L3R5_9SPHI|nr:fucose isomerase [Sphingobacterium tabacisoli]
MVSEKNKEAVLVCSGDLRPAANLNCWPMQQKMEEMLQTAFQKLGWKINRAHGYNAEKGHGFIDYQHEGIKIFRNIDKTVPLIVAESVWQYSHHVLAGLIAHQGPILVVANWDGTYPGLVGAMNLTGSLTKAEVEYSFLWSKDFTDDFFMDKLAEWTEKGTITHDYSHVKPFDGKDLAKADRDVAEKLAHKILDDRIVMGVFDEGCMGMFNAIVPDALIHKLGIFKERLSQSTLYAKMLTVSDSDAENVLSWMLNKGMSFDWGQDGATELTREQTIEQCKMYIAALRLADEFGCDTIGIQYQQGLKDLVPASDLVEGLLNNTNRPPVYSEAGIELYPGKALPHFNEVDECAGIDGYVTYHLWNALGLNGDNTLHDLRYGEDYIVDGVNEFVWVFLISGAAPASHFIGGYEGADSLRQPAMFFKKGGGTLRGISRPGKIVWSRVYIENNELLCDIGTGRVVELPAEETNRRWNLTDRQWPIMHGVLDGVSRDQMMAKHKANHIQVVYVDGDFDVARAAAIKGVAIEAMGIKVNFCGIN